MSGRIESAFVSGSAGMNTALPPADLLPNQYARATNVVIEQGYPTTRPGFVAHKLEGDSVVAFQSDNIQGAKLFNPAKGQGGIVLAAESSQIMVSCGGRKYQMILEGNGRGTKAKLTDVSNGFTSDPQLHLAWWDAWENYALCQNGESNCWIWDSENPAFESSGYNSVDKELSRVPNGGTVMCYVHGRGVVVTNSRVVLAGDILHKDSLSTSSNLLNFIDQVYWATGKFFLPPTEMGNVTAAATIPDNDNYDNSLDLAIHCEDGIFLIGLNVYPRSEWANRRMVGIASTEKGATGPYALFSVSKDQIFRTEHGIETLRLVANEGGSLGAPMMTISDGADSWMKTDYAPWLRFCSLVIWMKERRMLCTVSPQVRGRWRWHKGVAALNLDPVHGPQGDQHAWESVWTMPSETAGVVQMVRGKFDGRERLLFLCRGNDSKNRLAEAVTGQLDDVLEDGTSKRIECQLITRAISNGDPRAFKVQSRGKIALRNVRGMLNWGAWVRSADKPGWIPWRQGSIDAMTDMDLDASYAWSGTISLGELPDKCGIRSARWVQVLFRWLGHCQVESIDIIGGEMTKEEDEFKCEKLKISNTPPLTTDYTDWSYSENDSPNWINEETH